MAGDTPQVNQLNGDLNLKDFIKASATNSPVLASKIQEAPVFVPAISTKSGIDASNFTSPDRVINF